MQSDKDDIQKNLDKLGVDTKRVTTFQCITWLAMATAFLMSLLFNVTILINQPNDRTALVHSVFGALLMVVSLFRYERTLALRRKILAQLVEIQRLQDIWDEQKMETHEHS